MAYTPDQKRSDDKVARDLLKLNSNPRQVAGPSKSNGKVAQGGKKVSGATKIKGGGF